MANDKIGRMAELFGVSTEFIEETLDFFIGKYGKDAMQKTWEFLRDYSEGVNYA